MSQMRLSQCTHALAPQSAKFNPLIFFSSALLQVYYKCIFQETKLNKLAISTLVSMAPFWVISRKKSKTSGSFTLVFLVAQSRARGIKYIFKFVLKYFFSHSNIFRLTFGQYVSSIFIQYLL